MLGVLYLQVGWVEIYRLNCESVHLEISGPETWCNVLGFSARPMSH